MPEHHTPAEAWVCLTLLLPETLEERVVDWLLAHPDWPVEFSVQRVAARGPLVQLSRLDERVQGHAVRAELRLVLPRARLDALLAALQQLLAGADGGWWVSPVERFARFAAPPAGTPVPGGGP